MTDAPDAPADRTDALLTSRGSTHGSFELNADISQKTKRLWREAPGYSALHPVHREALDVIALKVSRILSGRPYEPDHWADIGGYARLAERVAPPFDINAQKASDDGIVAAAAEMLVQPNLCAPAQCINCGSPDHLVAERPVDGKPFVWCKKCGWKQ